MKHEITTNNTKRMLGDSLKKIMESKKLSKITVSDIISDCGLNRKTFYYHFDNINSLLQWIFQSEAFEMVKKFKLITDYNEAIVFVMDYVEDNDYIINCAYDSMGVDGLRQMFCGDFRDIAVSLIADVEKETGISLPKSYKSFLCLFFMEAVAGILIEWIKNHEKYSREDICEYLIRTVKASLTGIFNNV